MSVLLLYSRLAPGLVARTVREALKKNVESVSMLVPRGGKVGRGKVLKPALTPP